MSLYQTFLEKKLFLRYLINTNRPGVYALVNEKHKRVLIVGTKAIYQSLGNITQQLGNKTHSNKQLRKDIKYLRFKMLEYCESEKVVTTKVKWCHKFKTLGYDLYNTEKLATYKFSTRILADSYKVQVILISAGKRAYPVKEFNTQKEADEFVKSGDIFECLMLTR